MVGFEEPRWTEIDGQKVGSHALDYATNGATAYCLRESKKFDIYCHQYNAGPDQLPRYADFTAEGEDGDGEPTTEGAYCLAQDCMFDYCIWRRDERLIACEAFVAKWEGAV